ncbi:MAG TPA: hypothetical protein PKI33_02610 [Anaerolineales bacterium]|nr:hypothetical protein [Anaerolineales bacterium]
MTITLPILDLFFCTVLFFLFAFCFYQGWEICFMQKNEPLFPYQVIALIASYLGKEDEFRERTSHLRTSFLLRAQGVSALLGGALGIVLCVVFFINIISRVIINE